MSELVYLDNRRFAAIERDGKGGASATKWITSFELGTLDGATVEATPPNLTKRTAIDLVSLFLREGHNVEKEIEGLTVASDGQVYAITDNDNNRPTLLIRLGPASEVLGR